MAEKYPDTNEAQFVDEVQQSLEQGRFLLLILGDGIREGAAAIADFIGSVGSLEFTFGLVEYGVDQCLFLEIHEYGWRLRANIQERGRRHALQRILCSTHQSIRQCISAASGPHSRD